MQQPADCRLALLGCGAIARHLLGALRSPAGAHPVGAILARQRTARPAGWQGRWCTTLDELLAWRPALVVECAGQAAVGMLLPALLTAGTDVVVASIGALTEPEVLARLEEAARQGGASMILPAGAVGGLDALHAARLGGLTRVRYRGRKPPLAWRGTPAEAAVDLAPLETATPVFVGTALEAARRFPKNANVTAAIALAGLGAEATEVELIADPAAPGNRHEIEAEGAFGRLHLTLENEPLPDNPRTSLLAALSLEMAVRDRLSSLAPRGAQ